MYSRKRTYTGNYPMAKKARVGSGRSQPYVRKPLFKSVVRSLIRNAAEPKHKIIYDTKNIGNGVYKSVNLTGNIANGGTSQQREGDSIRLEYLKATIGLPYGQYSSIGRFSSNYRILLVQSLKETGGASSEWANNTFNSTDLFLEGAAYRQVDGIIDKKKVNVLYDKTFDVRATWATVGVEEEFIFVHEKEDGLKFVTVDVPIQQVITYKQGTNYTTQKKNLYLIVICNNGSENTNFGNVTLVADLCFKETK